MNQKQNQFLKKTHQNGRLAQTLLLVGPEGVGKFESAVDLALLVNKWKDRKAVEKGQKTDLFLVEPEIVTHRTRTRKKDISIDQTKEVLGKISLHAFEADYKIVLIKEPERMTLVAANSLLKNLEEPASDTIYILISHSENSLLSTVRSRCQIVRFYLATEKEIEKALAKEFPKKSQKVIEECAQLAKGRMGVACDLVKNIKLRKEVKSFQDKFRQALKGGLLEGLNLAEEFSTNQQKSLTAIDEWLWGLEKLLRRLVKEKANPAMIEKVTGLTKALVSLRKVIKETNANQKIQLENYFVQL